MGREDKVGHVAKDSVGSTLFIKHGFKTSKGDNEYMRNSGE